jgi:hypothetical protein
VTTEPLRTGCVLITETRLKVLMVIATQITVEISSSDSADRASAYAAVWAAASAGCVVASAREGPRVPWG